MDTKSLSRRIAPMTRSQYEAKMAEYEEKAKDMLNSVVINGRKICLHGYKRCGNHIHEDFVRFSNWNPRTQRLTVSYGFTNNEIPKSVAKENILAYLLCGYEDEFFY